MNVISLLNMLFTNFALIIARPDLRWSLLPVTLSRSFNYLLVFHIMISLKAHSDVNGCRSEKTVYYRCYLGNTYKYLA